MAEKLNDSYAYEILSEKKKRNSKWNISDNLSDYIQNMELTLSTTFILERILLKEVEPWKNY